MKDKGYWVESLHRRAAAVTAAGAHRQRDTTDANPVVNKYVIVKFNQGLDKVRWKFGKLNTFLSSILGIPVKYNMSFSNEANVFLRLYHTWAGGWV